LVIKSKNFCIVLSSPSGAGKTSISKKILKKDKSIALSISCTTRPRRKGEKNNKDYIFMIKDRFEKLVKSNLKNQIILIQAFKENIFLGCSLHFIGDNTLYGRYWGALEEVPFLHFELCYYQAIEFAIQNKLRKVEAGAQGEHKISRGYIPELTYSNHWFESQELKESINIFFYEEGKKVKDTIEYLKKLSPFKN